MKKAIDMRSIVFLVWVAILFLGGMAILMACLDPVAFNPDNTKHEISGEISTTDITAAVLMLTNRSKTTDVTNVAITQPEWKAPEGNPNQQAPYISFANRPKRLEKKAQYLSPSDKSYQVVIDYAFDALYEVPAGTDTKTLHIPIPLPRQIVEVFIYRDINGNVIIDTQVTNADPDDTGNPPPESSHGEGSVPSVIPPEYRNIMATFIVISKTNSQTIDNVNFKMGTNDYTMGSIGVNNRQSIALGQGSWETRVTYIRNDTPKTLGPVNSIIVPSHDPQAIKEHYLYFYLNKRGDYSISQEWPPDANDVEEEDVLPPDNGFGRGLIKIVNNSYAMAKTVTIHNLKEVTRSPIAMNYTSFVPSVPVQYKKTGFVDVIGTSAFPIDAHEDYLIQVSLETSEGFTIFQQKAYIKDQVVTLLIEPKDLDLINSKGAKVIMQNNSSVWPVEIVSMTVRNIDNPYQSFYYTRAHWIPAVNIVAGQEAVQYVRTTPLMPIAPNAKYKAEIAVCADGRTGVIDKDFDPPELYSENSIELNVRYLTITDDDIPDIIKNTNLSIGAEFTLKNQVRTEWPIQVIGMEIRNKADRTQSSYYYTNTWLPRGKIGNNNEAVQNVMSSLAMPITLNDHFEALITLFGNNQMDTISKPFGNDVLYSTDPPANNQRTIIISDSDIKEALQPPIQPPDPSDKGANVTVRNQVTTDWPIQIVGMTVQNKIRTAENTSYYWDLQNVIVNGTSKQQLVTGSAAMPIVSGEEFVALVYLYGNGQTAMVTKDFTPTKDLFSATNAPANNPRYVTIADNDVPAGLKPQQNQDDPQKEKQKEIAEAELGDLISIDGIIWVKVKQDGDNVLLMKYEVITKPADGKGGFMFHSNVNFMNYSDANIRKDVDDWYTAIPAPILKSIALFPRITHNTPATGLKIPAIDTGSIPSTPGAKAGSATSLVTFLPRYADIMGIKNKGPKLGTYYDYWLTDFIDVGMSNTSSPQPYMGLVIGANSTRPDPSGTISSRDAVATAPLRPVIWVTTK